MSIEFTLHKIIKTLKTNNNHRVILIDGINII